MTRVGGWEQRLRRFLDQAALWKYDAVNAHCGHFILSVVAALGDTEPARICARLAVELPTNEREVRALLAAHGGMRGLAWKYLGGEPRTDMLNAREGDVAVLDGDEGETLGVVEGGGVLCVASDRGLLRVRLDQANGYWKL